MKKITFTLLVVISSSFVYSQTYFPYKKDGKWGVYNKISKEVFITEFDSIAPFSQHINENFTDKHPYAIAYTSDYKKIINFKGDVLLDSLLNASEVKSYEDKLVLKANYSLPFYKFSKSNKQLYGYFYPEKDQIIVPDKYKFINFYFNSSDNNKMYYYGYDTEKKALDIFNLTENKLITSVKCDSYQFDNELNNYYDRPKELFIIIKDNSQSTILNFKGKELISKGLYENINIFSNEIIIDDKTYNLKGNFLKKNISKIYENDEEIEETFIMSKYDDIKLIDMGDNKFSIKNLDVKFEVKKKWEDVELFKTNRRTNKKPKYIRYSYKNGKGVYDFENEKTIIDSKYNSIVFNFYDVNNNYEFLEPLSNEINRNERLLGLFSVQDKDKKFNFYNPRKEHFLFNNWYKSISVLYNYDYISSHDYFIVKKEEKIQLYDLNGILLLDNVKYISIKEIPITSSGDTHKVNTYCNRLNLRRYLYVIFESGNSGYIYIDNENWKVNHLYPIN